MIKENEFISRKNVIEGRKKIIGIYIKTRKKIVIMLKYI